MDSGIAVIADIATGHHAGADILFLIAAVVFGLAAILPVLEPVTPPRPPYARISWIAAGLCLLAIAWLIL